jgi:hypothetical protein
LILLLRQKIMGADQAGMALRYFVIALHPARNAEEGITRKIPLNQNQITGRVNEHEMLSIPVSPNIAFVRIDPPNISKGVIESI